MKWISEITFYNSLFCKEFFKEKNVLKDLATTEDLRLCGTIWYAQLILEFQGISELVKVVSFFFSN